MNEHLKKIAVPIGCTISSNGKQKSLNRKAKVKKKGRSALGEVKELK